MNHHLFVAPQSYFETRQQWTSEQWLAVAAALGYEAASLISTATSPKFADHEDRNNEAERIAKNLAIQAAHAVHMAEGLDELRGLELQARFEKSPWWQI
jgi:hypothetical protein